MKKLTAMLAATATAVLLSSPAMAFHSGGVAECEGCHTMHNSYEGKVVEKEDGTATGLATQFKSGPFLLKGNDQSSACLNCHESTPGSYHISTPKVQPTTGPLATNPITQFTPGGDFSWLKISYTYSAYNANGSEESAGERHGHNIIAADYGYVADSTQTKAPGGNYDPTKFYCSSCHDPHGRYRRAADDLNFATTGKAIYSSGSYGGVAKTVNGTTYAVGAYRILGGKDYAPKSYAGVTPFVNDPPLAIAPSSYNTSDVAGGINGTVIVKYGSGMSEWCGNCHGGLVLSSGGWTSGMGGLVHPVGGNAKLSQGYPNSVATNYNAYVSSGVMTGSAATSYSNLVPFETGDVTTATLKAEAALPVAGSNSQAMCLSCHRAHASGFSSMLRFDAGSTEFQTTLDAAGNPSYNGTDINGGSASPSPKNLGRSLSDWQASYWGRPAAAFGGYQRVLCNKCHAKD
jgi:predicted CXXCH cytochrome family protein